MMVCRDAWLLERMMSLLLCDNKRVECQEYTGTRMGLGLGAGIYVYTGRKKVFYKEKYLFENGISLKASL